MISRLPVRPFRSRCRHSPAEAGGALARSLNHTRNAAEGAFGTTTARRTGVTVAFDQVGYTRPGAVAVTDAALAPMPASSDSRCARDGPPLYRRIR